MTINPKALATTARLTFADEFDSLSLRTGTAGTWSTKYPFAPPEGGSLPSNGEQEWYIHHQYPATSAIKPWTVSSGILTLTGSRAPAVVQPLIGGYQFISGMVNTFHSFTQLYGYFEMRAQLPKGQGLWPAFWLMPFDMSWPPEIDVMEVLGHDMTTLNNAVHSNATGAHTSTGAAPRVADMSLAFHNYGVDWQQDKITFYFDGDQVSQMPTPADCHKPMYMIANLAMGGYWPGMIDATTPLPARMQIDYIRAYAGITPGSPAPQPPPAPPSVPTPSGKGIILTADDTAGQKLVGSTGDDIFHAGHNSVVMTGEGGANTYVFDYEPWNPGRITDFKVGIDRIDLSPLGVGDAKVEAHPDGAAVVFKNPARQWATLMVILERVPIAGLTMAKLTIPALIAPTPLPTEPPPVPPPPPPPPPVRPPPRKRRPRRR